MRITQQEAKKILQDVKTDPQVMARARGAGQLLGMLGYYGRLAKYGLKHIQAVARQNGKRGGRPRKPLAELSAAAKYQRLRREKLRKQGGKQHGA